MGFAGEGPSDFDFLKPLAFRVLEQVLLERSTFQFELPAPVDVHPGGRPGNAPSAVVDLVKSQFRHLDILFYHADAGGGVDATYANLVLPVARDLEEFSIPVVGIVPRREMESWATADAEGLCAVLGLEVGRVPLPLEFVPNRVESILDPKRALRDFIGDLPIRRFKPIGAEFSFLGSLALRVSLHQLLRVPQFARFVCDMECVLKEKGLI